MTITSPKKRYEQPHLVVYGSISEITKAVGDMGSVDGGSGMTTKTRPG